MDVLERIGKTGLVPVAVLDNVEDAVPAAQALLAAGLDIMEITLRTDAGIAAIRAVSEQVPGMLVGAGTVLSLEKCQESVAAGAKFIVSPGYDPIIVSWCLAGNIPITPGCVTPTEITTALNAGLKTVKFFPANIYGGVKACAGLYAPFKSAGLSFIPTGGISNDNLSEYADKSFILAVGGGWLCDPVHVNSHDFASITETAKAAINALLGFEVAHIGINQENETDAANVGLALNRAFGFTVKEGNNSNFASPAIEILKSGYLGKMGHVAIRTNSIVRAIHYLEKRGFIVDMGTAKFKSDKMIAVYLKDEIGGFALHLLQKQAG